MFVRMRDKPVDEPIALWDTLERAEAFYDDMDGVYGGYVEDADRLTHAYATPVHVYRIG